MTENPYDQVPYGHCPHPQTHPDRLCSIGRLFGLPAADPRNARVLELGCASGGNLIPMAFNLPSSRFLGIDSSGEQILDGRRRVEDLGLENIELRRQSILDFEDDGEPFDYIICHGVFSWVDDDVREAIFEICRTRLADHGIVQLSFNTLPGWNMIKSVRDLMLFHARNFQEPSEKAEQARALLQWVTAAAEGDDTPYSLLFRREIELLEEVDDSYLLHDHLSELNRPEYFHEFMEAARGHDLEFLADSDLATMLPENLPEAVAEKLREIGDLVRTEQYRDFLVGRRFRNTLLCRAGVPLERELSIASLHGFGVSTPCSTDGALEPHHFEDGVEVQFLRGRTSVSIRRRVGKIAFSILAAERGRPIALSELMARVAKRASVRPDDVEELIETELRPIRLLFANALEIHSLPPDFTAEVQECPSASRLARYQSRRGERVTNQKHETVRLEPAERLILKHLDGARSVPDLALTVADAVARGDLELRFDGRPADRGEASKEAVQAYCSRTLEKLARSALLVEPPDGV